MNFLLGFLGGIVFWLVKELVGEWWNGGVYRSHWTAEDEARFQRALSASYPRWSLTEWLDREGL